jgi:hypothetical protein
MKKITANEAPVPWLGEDWFDPLEAGVRQHIRSLIEAMLESELEAVLRAVQRSPRRSESRLPQLVTM